jgi:hemerythrin-like domain-containing protein
MSDTRVISRSPVDLLTAEHHLFASLLEDYEHLPPMQVSERTELIRRIEEEVDRHIGTEESLFYPTLLELKDPVLHERVAEVLAEHRQMEALIDDLRRSHPGAKADLVLDVLRSLVDRHTAYEQKELFPFASRLPRVTRNQLGLEIEERRWREDRF